jgi:hypothetical protein
MLTGCPAEPEEPPPPITYTIWTDVISYSDFYSAFQATLNDGYYARIELQDAQWNQISPSLTNEGKHDWTEDQLYNYFIGRGFGLTEANQHCSEYQYYCQYSHPHFFYFHEFPLKYLPP